MITANEIHYAAGSREILRGVDFQVTEGEFVGLIGPNGSGKSTFLKNLYKVLRPQRGAITLCGEDLLSMSNREMAQRMAVMVQEQEAAFDFTVEEVVMMGRQARKRLLETDSREDWALVGEILDLTGCRSPGSRASSRVQGGEKQRVLIGPQPWPNRPPCWCWMSPPTTWISSTSCSSWSWCEKAAAPWSRRFTT